MLKNISLLGVVLFLFLGGCQDEGANQKADGPEIIVAPAPDGKSKPYVHAFFDSEEECMKHQPDPNFWMNCDQRLWLYEDSKVELILSDIVNTGRYIIEDNALILTLDNGGDAPQQLHFIIASKTRLVRQDDKTEWSVNE
jgi:hypothetical protein